MTQWARAGDALRLESKNGHLINQVGTKCWIRSGTTLLVPAKTSLVVKWLASCGQDLFEQLVIHADGNSELAENFLLRVQTPVNVLFVPQDVRVAAIDLTTFTFNPDGKSRPWSPREEVGMSFVGYPFGW